MSRAASGQRYPVRAKAGHHYAKHLLCVFALVRYGLKTRARKELTTGTRSAESAWIFTHMSEQSTREYRWEFFIDSVILAVVNSLIMIFELSRTEYGIVLLIAELIIAFAGLVATEAKSVSTVSMLIFLLAVLLLGQLGSSWTFGTRYEIMGFDLLPKHVFFLPLVALLTLIILVTLLRRRTPSGH